MKGSTAGPAIGLLVADIGNPFFVELSRGVAAGLDQAGYLCLIADCNNDSAQQLKLASNLVERGVEGLIVTVPHNPAVLTLDIPLVAVDRVGGGIPYVGVNNVLGGKQAVQHLARSGYERIGILYGLPELTPVADRLEGYRQGLKSLPREVDPALEVECATLDYDSGYEGARQLIAAGADSVFAIDDVLGAATLAAARDEGLSVPDQLGVVGYDDTPMASWPTLDLTSVAQGTHQLGMEAAALILKRIKSPQLKAAPSVLPPRLVSRGSSARGVAVR